MYRAVCVGAYIVLGPLRFLGSGFAEAQFQNSKQTKPKLLLVGGEYKCNIFSVSTFKFFKIAAFQLFNT